MAASVQFGHPHVIYAPTCGGPSAISEELVRVDEVFVGEVQRVRLKASLIDRARMHIWNVWLSVSGNGRAEPDRSAEGRVVEMAVLERFKGPPAPTAGILIGDDAHVVEIPYAPGERYLIFGSSSGEPNLLIASMCGRTDRLPDGANALDEVRKLTRGAAK